MFPARAGMSRAARLVKLAPRHVPRASGDEPIVVKDGAYAYGCSPRERG